jgi:hypothetical protein
MEAVIILLKFIIHLLSSVKHASSRSAKQTVILHLFRTMLLESYTIDFKSISVKLNYKLTSE